MSPPSDDLREVPDALFSEGIRSDGQPRRPGESHFEFADRIRQPLFERQRRWFEDAFSRYPAGADRGDLCARFRSPDDLQHGAAEWELYQHEMWNRLGWELTAHPVTPDGRRRDFMVEREGDRFILECAVDNPSLQKAGGERRWQELGMRFKTLSSPSHGLMIHRRTIGSRSLSAGPLVSAVQRRLDSLLAGQQAVVLRVDTDGWRFHIEALPHLPPNVISEMHSGTMSMEQRLYGPIRNRVKGKSKGSSHLDLPFVLALQIVTELPIVSEDGAVRGALMGTWGKNDGLWAQAGVPRGRGLSGVLLQEGCSWVATCRCSTSTRTRCIRFRSPTSRSRK